MRRIKDESVHGTYIGAKFQLAFNAASKERQQELLDFTYDLLFDLYENECIYTDELYEELGLSEDVKTFLRYNANKALANLGFDPLFPDTVEDVDPIIINGLSGSAANHDFFSKVGNSYFVGKVEAMKPNDYDFEFMNQGK